MAGLEARLAALESQFAETQGEMGTLLGDIERVTASTQICLASLSEHEGPHQHQMLAALQALAGTRATLAAMLARREDLAGRWDVAAQLWQRAARSRPNDPNLLVRAADSLSRAGGDLALAESLVRQAIELSPEHREAQKLLATLTRRA